MPENGRPAPLLIAGGSLLNVFTGEIYLADVLCAGEMISAIGPPGSLADDTRVKTIDARGSFILPGLVNGHLHIESSMVTPGEYARAVVPHGTLTLIADPHEVANVAGLAGIRRLAAAAAGAPADVYFLAPSCVPATTLETAGAELGPAEVAELLADPRILGLGEVMNVPGVLAEDPGIMAKIRTALAAGKAVDGHAPGLSGPDLCRYVAMGVGSDHEATTPEEAREKWRLGMWLMIREGSAARNLGALLPLAHAGNGERMMFVTDDLHPDDLHARGELDDILRKAVAGGLDPAAAVRMATWNPAQYFRLRDRGLVAPGRRADLWIVAGLREFRTRSIVRGGRLIWDNGRWEPGLAATHTPSNPEETNSVHLPADLAAKLAAQPQAGTARVIGIIPGQIVTRNLRWPVELLSGGQAKSPAGEVCRLAVIERHGRNGNVGLGFVSGLGLGSAHGQPGGVAAAATVAHDSHNLVVAGTSDAAMHQAAEALAGAGGGFVVVAGGEVKAMLELPVAGLMADRPVAEVAASAARVAAAARELGMTGESPLMTLSFLALPVIPALKLTDRGPVDVAAFRHVPLWL